MKTKVLLLLALASFPGFAEVADSSPSGFTVHLSVPLKASPADAYRIFVHDVGSWWNADHTFFGSAKNLTLDDKAAGCFCEINPGGGSVRHLEVVYAAPGKALTMIGALGPMQSLAATGTMKLTFSTSADGTKLDMSYAIAGYAPKGMDPWASIADRMLTEQFTRFKNYVEKTNSSTK